MFFFLCKRHRVELATELEGLNISYKSRLTVSTFSGVAGATQLANGSSQIYGHVLGSFTLAQHWPCVCRDEASGDLDLAIGEDQCPAKV